MGNLSQEKREYIVNSFISGWTNTKRQFVSLDADTFSSLFFFLEPVHTIHDKETQNILFILVDRVKAIQAVKDRYSLKTGEEAAAEVKEAQENL